MKIAVTGKGGVGKTTLAGTIARILAADGYKVLAVDADPDANLASALGIAPDVARGIVPIADMKELIEERTGAKTGTMGGFFKINPRVDDIPDELSVPLDGIRLMVMGTVKEGAGGCVCPESVLLRSLVRHLLLRRKEAVILDMEAGIEHLGRGTASAVDAMIVVVEPGARSVRTADSHQEAGRRHRHPAAVRGAEQGARERHGRGAGHAGRLRGHRVAALQRPGAARRPGRGAALRTCARVRRGGARRGGQRSSSGSGSTVTAAPARPPAASGPGVAADGLRDRACSTKTSASRATSSTR